jgi:AcrR family transcriptional regulator
VGRREDNKQRKRERLEAEGLRLFLELGYDRASIEQVATGSDVARGTFYLYFPDKLGLFEALVDRWFAPLLALLDDVDSRLSEATSRSESFVIYLQMAEQLTAIALSHRDEILMSFREIRRTGEAGDRLRRREKQLHLVMTALTERAAERGLITVDDPTLATLVIVGAVEKLHYEWLVGTDLGDPAELAPRVMRLFARTLELPVLFEHGLMTPASLMR